MPSPSSKTFFLPSLLRCWLGASLSLGVTMRTLLVLVLALTICACVGAPQPASQCYAVNAAGQVRATPRSAVDPGSEPGPQELFGIKIPGALFGLPGLQAQAGIVWDGTTPWPGFIVWPTPQQSYGQSPYGLQVVPNPAYRAPQACPPAQGAPAPCFPAPAAAAPCQ